MTTVVKISIVNICDDYVVTVNESAGNIKIIDNNVSETEFTLHALNSLVIREHPVINEMKEREEVIAVIDEKIKSLRNDGDNLAANKLNACLDVCGLK